MNFCLLTKNLRVKRQIFISRKILYCLLIFISPSFCQNPKQSIMDINNITLWVGDNGFHDWLIKSEDEYFCNSYPKGTAGTMFTEGILWGGKVFDGNEKIIRVNGSNYSSGNSAITRLYRVRSDYFKADLTDDAANFFIVPKNQVSDSMISAIYKQYERDWNEWPAEKGAPFYDVNKDGKYEPDIDIPGVPGASQTLWINYNDDLSHFNYESPPIGLDIRETYWAYAYTGILGNVIYKKIDLIYKGTLSSPLDSRIDSMYIDQWADTDDGFYADDFLGCDTSLNLGYTYNATDQDLVYSKFLPAPPAFGYSILNGAAFKSGNSSDSAIINFKWRHKYRYFNSRPLTLFIAHRVAGDVVAPEYSYTGTLQYYNIMRGYEPYPPYPNRVLFRRYPQFGGPIGGYGTYMLDGDPVTNQGWIDGIMDPSGSRSMYLMSGPINMRLGDTIEVVLAIVGGLGTNHLSSISDLKHNTKGAVLEYNYLINDITSGRLNVPDIQRPSGNFNPKDYKLYQNFPNPFNSTTVIKYELPDDAHVTLVIYDILGRIVKTLVDEERTTGIYNVRFNADNLPSGIYFSKISFNNPKSKLVLDNLTKVNKLLLLK